MIRTRVIPDGGSVGLPPSRLVSTDGTITTPQGVRAPGDRLPYEEEFVAGIITGPPGTKVFIHYPGQ